MYTQKASIGVRFGALLLDNIFIGIACSFLFGISYYLYFAIAPFATFLYYGVCEGSSMSATLGKKICGLVVVDEHGNKLNSGQGFLRSLCRTVSSAIFGIGFLVALFDNESRALHDKMAKTFVAVNLPVVKPQMISTPQPQPSPVQRSTPMNNNPQIIGISGQFAGKAFPIAPQGIMLGRDSSSCDLAFADNTQGISRNHCKIQYNHQTQMFVVYDLGSSYGTFLSNGTKILQGQPTALRSDEEFYLASRANSFRVRI